MNNISLKKTAQAALNEDRDVTIYEKAVSYCRYCVKNGYTLDITYSIIHERFEVFTAGGTCVNYFYNLRDIKLWLAERYDDEKEAGNL